MRLPNGFKLEYKIINLISSNGNIISTGLWDISDDVWGIKFYNIQESAEFTIYIVDC